MGSHGHPCPRPPPMRLLEPHADKMQGAWATSTGLRATTSDGAGATTAGQRAATDTGRCYNLTMGSCNRHGQCYNRCPASCKRHNSELQPGGSPCRRWRPCRRGAATMVYGKSTTMTSRRQRRRASMGCRSCWNRLWPQDASGFHGAASGKVGGAGQ